MDAERFAAAFVKAIRDEASCMDKDYNDNVSTYALSQMLDRIAYNFEKLIKRNHPMDADKIETRLLEPWSHRPEFGFKATSMEDYEAVVREVAVIITAQAVLMEELVGALREAEDALDQMLDDMGKDGLCVCMVAKRKAIQARSTATATLSRVKQEGK